MTKLLKLKRLMFLPLLILISPSLLAEMKRVDMQFDNEDRHYLIYSPQDSSADSPIDLVIGFHGYTGTASGFELEVTGGFNQFAELYNFISVFPQSTYFFNNGEYVGVFNDPSGSQSIGQNKEICTLTAMIYPKFPSCKNPSRCSYMPCVDDIGFVKKLIEEIKRTYNIKNIYLFGNSNGGMFAQTFACTYPGLIAGVLNVSGSQHLGHDCVPEMPVNMVIYGSLKDEAIHPVNIESPDGYLYEAQELIANRWANKFHCLDFQEKLIRNQETFVEQTFNSCDENIIVKSIINLEGAHLWPEAGFIQSSKESLWLPYGYCATDLQPELKNEKCRTNLDRDPWGADYLVRQLLNIN